MMKWADQEKQRKKLRSKLKAIIQQAINNDDGFARLRGLSDEEWQAAQKDEALEEQLEEPFPPGRQWQPLVDSLTNVQKLVHLAMRYDVVDQERIRGELLRVRRLAYEDELNIQAANVGCAGRKARLGNGSILSTLNDMSERDAISIVNTYNYDLAIAIRNIFTEVPTANRYTYAARLRDWEAARSKWKTPQIEQFTESSARSLAQADFFRQNGELMGVARLEPRSAVCPICQGWISRGAVPVRIALNNPSPFHINCPHAWHITPKRVPRSECPLLWMGE
jgi:hypothetical protein